MKAFAETKICIAAVIVFSTSIITTMFVCNFKEQTKKNDAFVMAETTPSVLNHRYEDALMTDSKPVSIKTVSLNLFR